MRECPIRGIRIAGITSSAGGEVGIILNIFVVIILVIVVVVDARSLLACVARRRKGLLRLVEA